MKINILYLWIVSRDQLAGKIWILNREKDSKQLGSEERLMSIMENGFDRGAKAGLTSEKKRHHCKDGAAPLHNYRVIFHRMRLDFSAWYVASVEQRDCLADTSFFRAAADTVAA